MTEMPKADKPMTKREVLAIIGKIKGKERRKAMVCALVGCSRISEVFWGYRTCGRCGARLGDNLASVDYGRETAVIIGHNCPKCRANYRKCSWRDKLLTPNPFKKRRV